MGNVFFFDWEIKLMEWLQSFESGILTALGTVFSMLGEEYLMILILGVCFWCVNKELGRKVSLSLTGTAMFGTLAKGIALRRRPYMDNSSIKCIRAAHTDEDIMSVTAQGYSFPSLHCSMSSSVFGTIAVTAKKKVLTVLAFVLPLLIGWSRMYFGVHYPTDVLCGWILGVLSMFLLLALEKKWGYKVSFSIVLVVGIAGFFYCRDDEFFSVYGITAGLLAGFIFEEKCVKFEKPQKKVAFILRPICGVVVFVIVSTLLKLPVVSLASESHQTLLFVYRLFRYALSTFVIIGLYPWIFKKIPFLK